MIGTTSWLMRTASAFAQIERSIKAAPVQPGILYPPPQSSNSTGWISWRGWPEFEREGQNEAQRDRARAKTATTSPWVFADVQAIANEFSTAELIIKERVGDKLEDVDNHPLEVIWESPNPHMGRSFVTAFWAWSYVLSSRAYLYWVPDVSGTEIMECWPVPPFMIRPIPDGKDFIRGYAFKSSADADSIFIQPEYITYSHSVNLFDARDGLSFLAAAMTEIDADLAAGKWNLNFFDENNGVPDGFLGLDVNALDQDVERVRFELRDFFGGTKRGLAVGRTGDLKYQPFGRTQKDMEFGNGRELASKIIGRTLGFPDGYWSDLANRANAEQARRTMISGAVWPLLVRLAEDMNAGAGIVHRWYGKQFRAEFKDIRPEDKDLKMRELTTYQPFLIVNELREMIGQEAFDKNDPRGLMLVAEITKGAPLPGSPAAQLLEDVQAKKDEAEAQKQAALIEAGQAPPPEEAPPPSPEAGAPPAGGEAPPVEGEPPPEGEAPVKAFDLDRWERKALKSLRRFHKADVAFESDAIPLPEQVAIHDALKAAETAADVRRAFKRDGVIDRIIAAGGKQEDDIRVWRHKKTGKWAASIGDWASETTDAAIRKVLGDGVEIDSEWVPGDGYEEVKARRDATDTLLDDVDADARAWVDEVTT